jgi:hypothetical protein
MSAFTTSIVDPSTLSRAEREFFTEELYASHDRIFSGVSRACFAAYVVDSPADETRIQVLRDHEGTIRGYTAYHLFIDREGGEERAIVRLESGYEEDFRRRSVQGTFLIAEIVKLCARFPRTPKYILGCFVHPSAYVALSRHVDTMWPNPHQETPAEVEGLMQSLAQRFSMKPADGEGTYQVGWISRETRRERQEWRGRGDVAARFYLERNPGYREGHGLLTLIPLTPAGLGRGVWRFARRQLRRAHGSRGALIGPVTAPA